MDFGNRLVKARESLNYTQLEFSEKLELAPQSLSRYEKNKVKPSIELMEKLTNMFNINLNWLLTGKGDLFLEEESFSKEDYITKITSNLENLNEKQLKFIHTYTEIETPIK